GEGYRTARYTVTMTEDKTLNFWNNVKDGNHATEMITGDGNAVTKNFLAGEIVKDNQINIYDLSAVVSYFGKTGLDTDPTGNAKFIRYDLNRDGKIDSKDVAYVLVSWGE
ncbi:MAG: dockerin type I domain-containing protein, partial [Clostridia bacterium]|nr:dockerin type I domain-containing protein [Clostridia bacterium]